MNPAQRCPCGTGQPYGECCQPFHLGVRTAPTAVALMRSRFSAFVTGDEDYLLRTWDADTRPETLGLGDSPVRFTSLEIYETSGGGLLDTEGTVDFEAFYVVEGTEPCMHGSQRENSRFQKNNGAWTYVAEK